MKEMDVIPLDGRPWKEHGFQSPISPVPNKRKIPANFMQTHPCDIETYPKSSERLPRQEARLDFILLRKKTDQQPEGVDSFARISEEIILHIFKFLPKTVLVKCSSVCKRWRDLSYDESLWKRYDFGRKVIKSCVLETLLQRGVRFLRLAMSEMTSPVFSNSFLQRPQWYCNLQLLDLSVTYISASEISQFLSVCCNLKKLSLEHCTINDDCCKYLSRNKNLQVLNMALVRELSLECIHMIATNCERLREWNLSWTHFPKPSRSDFWSCMPKSIRRLNISGNRETFDDKDLIQIVNRCPDLVELDISDCHLLTNYSFELLLKNCPKLEHLHASRAFSIPTDSYRLLADMRNFKSLDIFRTLTDEALAKLKDFLSDVQINKNIFSTIARPTTGIRRTAIWGVRVRD